MPSDNNAPKAAADLIVLERWAGLGHTEVQRVVAALRQLPVRLDMTTQSWCFRDLDVPEIVLAKSEASHRPTPPALRV